MNVMLTYLLLNFKAGFDALLTAQAFVLLETLVKTRNDAYVADKNDDR